MPPGAKVVTVKSEILRGFLATGGLAPYRDILAYQKATEQIDDLNTQKGTDSPGFSIGFHFTIWRELWRGLSAGVYKQPTERQLAAAMASISYKIYCGQRKQQDLTPAQISECAGDYHGQPDDTAWEQADASKQYMGTFPKAR